MRRYVLIGLVVAVVAGAAFALATAPRYAVAERAEMVVIMAALAALVSARPVRIPALKTELIATEPFMLYTLAAIGPLGAGLVSLAGVSGTVLGANKRPRAIQLVFNLGAVVLSTMVASVVFLALGGKPGARVLDIMWPLAVATATYFTCNTGLVAAAIALEKTQGYFETWRKSFSWAGSSFFTGLSISVGLLLVLETLGPWGLALAIPPCWLVVAYYRAYKGRLEEQRRRRREVEALNTELESTVQELKAAMAHVKQLQGLIPICMHCKSIRDDEDSWHRLETYISEHSEATFTHSLCQQCREKHYPGVAGRDTARA
jgi:hypothetical protein